MENDSTSLKSNGKFGSQYQIGQPMPHTCWEEGGGYYHGRIWHRSNTYGPFYLFDPFDT